MIKKTIAKSFVELNSIKESNDDSVVSFAEPLAITDNTRQWNMTKYDINTLNIESYDGTVTADHGNKIIDVIGKVINLRKRGNQVLIDGIKFAVKENPVAILAKNLMKGGFVTGVSIETIGDDPAPDGTWLNHSLCGLSVVAHPNNKNAYAVIANSLKEAQTNGFDVSNFSEEYKQQIKIADRHERVMNKIDSIYTVLNGGKGSGNHNPGQGRGVGKPSSGGSHSSGSSKGKNVSREFYTSEKYDSEMKYARSSNPVTSKRKDAAQAEATGYLEKAKSEMKKISKKIKDPDTEFADKIDMIKEHIDDCVRKYDDGTSGSGSTYQDLVASKELLKVAKELLSEAESYAKSTKDVAKDNGDKDIESMAFRAGNLLSNVNYDINILDSMVSYAQKHADKVLKDEYDK